MTLSSIVGRISEIKPLIESVMMLAGGVALIKWVSERRNRATDVLLGLEREFDVKCAAARSLIENDSEYSKIKDVLAGSIDGRESKVRLGRQLEIDNLLRFYLVLLAVR